MSSSLNNAALVSIGLFVHNGEKYLRQALDSLLAQDYANFELIISDNASTDRTAEICREYESSDRRIKYYRSDKNMGAMWNANRVFELSAGDYFMWAAHDDRRDPRYVRLCVDKLNQNEKVILVSSQFQFVDRDTGQVDFVNMGITTVDMSAAKRYKLVVSQMSELGGIFYGVYRKSVMRNVMPLKLVYASDLLFLSELSLYGYFLTLPLVLISLRTGGESSNPKGYISSSRNISNPFFRRFPFMGWFLMAQMIAMRSDRLHWVDKIGIFLFLIADYLSAAAIRAAASINHALTKIFPSLGNRIRKSWYVAQQAKRRPGGGGARYDRILHDESAAGDKQKPG